MPQAVLRGAQPVGPQASAHCVWSRCCCKPSASNLVKLCLGSAGRACLVRWEGSQGRGRARQAVLLLIFPNFSATSALPSPQFSRAKRHERKWCTRPVWLRELPLTRRATRCFQPSPSIPSLLSEGVALWCTAASGRGSVFFQIAGRMQTVGTQRAAWLFSRLLARGSWREGHVKT